MLLLPLLQCVDRIAQRLDRLIDLVLTICRGCLRQQSLRRADGLLQRLDRFLGVGRRVDQLCLGQRLVQRG